MSELRVIRLHPNDPLSWRLWPELEARIARFAVALEFDPPPERLYTWLRQTFVGTPEILGCWLALEDETIRGHMLAWADAFLGEPFVFVYQCEADDGQSMAAIKHLTADMLTGWIEGMNASYEEKGLPLRIRELRFSTTHDEKLWARYLRLLGDVQKERVILSVKLKTLTAPTPEPMLIPPPGAGNGHRMSSG